MSIMDTVGWQADTRDGQAILHEVPGTRCELCKRGGPATCFFQIGFLTDVAIMRYHGYKGFIMIGHSIV